MSIIRFVLALYFLSNVANVYSDEYPLIYISIIYIYMKKRAATKFKNKNGLDWTIDRCPSPGKGPVRTALLRPAEPKLLLGTTRADAHARGDMSAPLAKRTRP